MRWKKEKSCSEWHRYFAWFPITIGDMVVWLEYVERRGEFVEDGTYDYLGTYYGWEWEYRFSEMTNI